MAIPEAPWVPIVGCGRKKLDVPAPAQHMYTGTTVRAAIEHAKLCAPSFLILSGKHGLLPPDVVIEPYDQNLEMMGRHTQHAWARLTASMMRLIIPDGYELLLLSVPSLYRDLLRSALEGEYRIHDPLRGVPRSLHAEWYESVNSRQMPQYGYADEANDEILRLDTMLLLSNRAGAEDEDGQ